MAFHSHLEPTGILDSNEWMIYTISSHYVYFVNMPYPSWEYSVKFCPSTSQSQFNEAKRLARMKIEDFVGYSERYRHFQGKAICRDRKNIGLLTTTLIFQVKSCAFQRCIAQARRHYAKFCTVPGREITSYSFMPLQTCSACWPSTQKTFLLWG